MGVFELLFGEAPPAALRPALTIAAPPADVEWRQIRPRRGPVVHARLATEDGAVRTAGGLLHYRAGQHYILDRGRDGYSVIGRDIFERTYRARPDGAFDKRTHIVYRYFKLSEPARVMTREGAQLASPGDWIVEGVDAELWPVPAAKARRLYIELGGGQP